MKFRQGARPLQPQLPQLALAAPCNPSSNFGRQSEPQLQLENHLNGSPEGHPDGSSAVRSN